MSIFLKNRIDKLEKNACEIKNSLQEEKDYEQQVSRGKYFPMPRSEFMKFKEALEKALK